MKSLPWFRMYSDFMFDETVGLLSPADQRHYIFLLCIQHAGMLDKGYDSEMLARMVAKRLSLSVIELSELVGRLDCLGLISPDTYKPIKTATFSPERPLAHVWREIRERIFARDNYTCQYCGERGKKLECDHVHPFSRGGSNDDSNLTTSCLSCNRSKRDKTVSEWRPA